MGLQIRRCKKKMGREKASVRERKISKKKKRVALIMAEAKGTQILSPERLKG